jgi:hypothetical protein
MVICSPASWVFFSSSKLAQLNLASSPGANFNSCAPTEPATSAAAATVIKNIFFM